MDHSKLSKIDKSLSVEDRIGFLKYCADQYELGSSPISDAEYDQEYYFLESQSPDHKFFQSVGGIDEEHIYGSKVKHQYIMGSLSKCPTVQDFDEWLRNNFKEADCPVFTLWHKVDGLSLSLLYRDGVLVQAVTRGDGEIGVDVTPNAECVNGVLKKINFDGEIEIRGECYKEKKDFYANWAKEYANPRNFTSGSLNQKTPEITRERGLSFVAYEIVRQNFKFESDKNIFLNDLGFMTLRSSTKRTKHGLSFDNIVLAVKTYMDSIDRANLDYDIDGIVVRLNDIDKAKAMGSVANGRKPKSARAVKFKPEEAVTKFIGVEVNTGRTGKVSPVAILEPVSLAGTIVKRASLHNFGALVGKGAIKIGATVVLAKKGDIIPQVIRIDKEGDTPVDIPSVCPSCGNPISWNDTKVDLVCDNISCPAQSAKRIENFFKVIGVKGLGNGIISDLISLEWNGKSIVNSISDMYSNINECACGEFPAEKYLYLEGHFGDKAFKNILSSIWSVKEVTLNVFVEALGIAKIGSMSKDITDIAPSVEEIDKLTAEDISKIPGFGPIKAGNFVSGWKMMRPEIENILKCISIKQNVQLSNKLSGKKFCFTGSFSIPRTELEKNVVDNGGKCSSAGKDTILVWDGAISGSKYDKSIKVGAKIISEDEFKKMLE